MSRGNVFVSPRTQHYFYLPKLEDFGLAYMDAYNFNILANPSNPIGARYKEVTDHPDVGIFNYESWAELGICSWLTNVYGCETIYYAAYSSTGDVIHVPVNFSGGFTANPENLEGLIKYVETTSYGQRSSDLESGQGVAKLLHNIQTSIFGCLMGSIHYSPTEDGYYPHNGVRIFFPQPWSNNTNRSASIKGTTLYSAVPRRATGAKYHYRGSIKEDEGVHTGGGAGLSDDDHSATVSGPMKLKWNPAQNVWEAGSTFLAVLLTNVDGANVRTPGVTRNNLDGRTSEEFYSSGGLEKMSDFTTGLAMPINLQSSSPKSFGPNLIKCGSSSSKVETIRVVNRAKTNFDAGERVLVYQIDGENIIGKFTEAVVEEREAIPGRWNFAQFMSNSDEYFRHDIGNSTWRPPILPEAAAQALYAKYYQPPSVTEGADAENYNSDGARITEEDVELNKLADSMLPVRKSELNTFKLFEYWQIKTYDMMDYVASEGAVDEETGEEDASTRTIGFYPMWGGRNHRCNIEVDPAGSDSIGQEGVLGYEMPLFFGPMFPDGVVTKVFAHGYDWNRTQTPADVVYTWSIDAHETIKRLNRAVPAIIGVSGVTSSAQLTMPNNMKRVQFSFLQPDLMGCGDYATRQLPSEGGSVGRFGAFNTDPRRFPLLAAKYAGEAIGKDYAGDASMQLLGNMFARRSNGVVWGNIGNQPGGPGAMYEGFFDPGSQPYCFKYDAYIDYVPLNKPINCAGLFGGDTGPESRVTPGEEFFGGQPGIWVGANAVGISSARLTLSQGSGEPWTLSCNTNQTFGMKGRFFGGGGGGGIVATIIGAMMAFANDTRGRTIEGSVPMWGSTSDHINSFGTGCCHVQVWDAWPDEFTTWCPQYMFSLHKNPYPLEKNPRTQMFINLGDPFSYKYEETVVNYKKARKDSNGNWREGKEPEEIQIDVGYPSTMTYKEPTYGDTVTISAGANDENPGIYASYNSGKDGQLVPRGTTVGSYTVLRPTNLWYNNRKRESKLCSLYGYKYIRNVLGVKDNGTVISMTEGFLLGDYKVGRGEKEIHVNISGRGDNAKVKIKKKGFSYNDGTVKQQEESGEYNVSDLPVSYTITDGLGKTCIIRFFELECQGRYCVDQGPKPRSELTRVSKPSTSGTEYVVGNKGTSIMVNGNANVSPAYSPYPSRTGNILEGYGGRYETLVYVHNDVSFTWSTPPEATTGNQFAQYITLSLG